MNGGVIIICPTKCNNIFNIRDSIIKNKIKTLDFKLMYLRRKFYEQIICLHATGDGSWSIAFDSRVEALNSYFEMGNILQDCLLTIGLETLKSKVVWEESYLLFSDYNSLTTVF